MPNFSNGTAYQGSGRLEDSTLGRPSMNASEYSEKIAQAKSAYNILQQQLYSLQENNTKKDEEIKTLQETNKLLHESKESHKNDKDKITNDLLKIKNELLSLQKKNSEKENELILTKKALDHSNAELHKLDLTKNSLVPELKQLRTKLGSVELALEKSKAQLESSDKARHILENETQSLKTVNEALQRQLEIANNNSLGK
jgi:chromosome segregation ATPase